LRFENTRTTLPQRFVHRAAYYSSSEDLLAVAERAGAVELAPGQGGRVRVQPTGRLDRAKVSQLCRAAADRRWQSYRSIEHYAAANDRCRRRQ